MIENIAGTIILLWGWKRAFLAIGAGAVSVLALPPFYFFAPCLISFPILVWLLDGATPAPGRRYINVIKPAFSIGWCFGFGYFTAGLWWTSAALLVGGNENLWALPLAIFGLPAVLALFFGLACALAKLVWSDDLGRILALGVAFALCEWLRSFLFTGFPWNAIGHTAMPTPMFMQSLPILGMNAMNGLAVIFFSLPALLAGRKYRKTGIVLMAMMLLIHGGFGWWQLNHDTIIENSQDVRIRLVQPSILQDSTWDDERRAQIFKTHLALTSQKTGNGDPLPDIIVWPETAVPYLITNQPDVLAAIGNALQPGQILITGAVRAEGDVTSDDARYYNSIVVINDSGEIIDAADKVHLVPFGEYMPYREFFESFGVEKLVQNVGVYSRAQTRSNLVLQNGLVILPLICYETIFSDEITISDPVPDMIINVTDDSWFNNTPGPYQHFYQAQLRAVENGIPLIRSANNGISGVIDGKGRIIDAFALNSVGALDITVKTGQILPFFIKFPSNFGFLLILALAFLSIIMALLARTRVK